MRVAARTLGRAAILAVAFSPLILRAGARAADDSAAHAIAEKFSRAEDAERAAAAKKAEAQKKAEAEKARAEAQRQAERRKAASAQHAADEAEMLERAREEAEARRQDDERAAAERARVEAEQEAARAEAARLAQDAEARRIEDDRRAEEARQAEAQRLAKEVEDNRLAEDRKAEEARQAEVARQAEDARIAKEAEEKRLAEQRRAARLANEAEAARQAEARRKAEETRQADAAREALEQQRTEEAERVAEKFRVAREAREARQARERAAAAPERDTDTRNSLGGPATDAVPPAPPWNLSRDPGDAPDSGPARFLPARVTVLLVMDPRHRIFPAYPPAANPVLCIGPGCYISGGADAPAEYMPRGSALGPVNSIGRRAGPCRNQLTCVFRDVELGGGYAQIQPVDMGLMHHDRREIRGVRPDPTCDLTGGHLFCAEPVVGKGYRAWIVPEVIATKAGAEALREALAHGLPAARSATIDPAIDPWQSHVHAESSR